MAQSFIRVPPDSTGKLVDSRQLVVGANTVERQRIEYGITVPVITYVTSASLAAGASVTLDSAQLTASMTGRLWGVLVASTVSFRAELFTVANAVASASRGTAISHIGYCFICPPAPDFVTVAYSVTAGLDGFRVIVTNLDLSEAADVYCTFYYDEELT